MSEPVSCRDGSLLARSAGRKLVNSPFAGTWGSEKGRIKCSLGKAAYAGGTGESVASSSFSVIIPLFRARRAVCLLPRSLLDPPAFASTLLVAVGRCLSTQSFPGHCHRAGQGGAGYYRISVALSLLFGVLLLALYLAVAAEEAKGGRRAVACA